MVLDASAILAAMLGEAGGERIGQLTGTLLVSAVNYAEVGAKLSDLGYEASLLAGAGSLLNLQVVPFDIKQAEISTELRRETRKYGLSLGDRSCLALASSRGAPALTADRAWKNFELPIEIEMMR